MTAGPDDPKTRKSANAIRSRVSAALDASLDVPLAPGLYIVSTPIGNLEDITLRALSTLQRADLVLCEDTRHSRKLMQRYGIDCKLQPYHEHNAAKSRPAILKALESGQTVALISDAGTPLISDPGYKLVNAAREVGHAVTSVPGASALLAALSASGLPSDRFHFEGFLPPKQQARRKRLEALGEMESTLIFYEAPQRLEAMLVDASGIFGERAAAVARELTKLHESVMRGSLGELVDKLGTEIPLKGEFVILVAPPAREDVNDTDIRQALARAQEHSSLRDAAREVAQALGVSRSRVYALGLAMQEKGS